jgi:hypothetical protein
VGLKRLSAGQVPRGSHAAQVAQWLAGGSIPDTPAVIDYNGNTVVGFLVVVQGSGKALSIVDATDTEKLGLDANGNLTVSTAMTSKGRVSAPATGSTGTPLLTFVPSVASTAATISGPQTAGIQTVSIPGVGSSAVAVLAVITKTAASSSNAISVGIYDGIVNQIPVMTMPSSIWNIGMMATAILPTNGNSLAYRIFAAPGDTTTTVTVTVQALGWFEPA